MTKRSTSYLYDFRYELALCLNKCLTNLFNLNQYATKSSIKKMEHVDLLYCKKKISLKEHDIRCKAIKEQDRNQIQKIIDIIDLYIAYHNNDTLNAAYYSLEELQNMNHNYAEMFNKALKDVLQITKKII